MTDTPRHSGSVAAAIFDDTGENVLLIKRRDNGRWEPPGGVLELDETIEEGPRREVREEAGTEIQVGPLTGVYKNMSAGIDALVFRCAALGLPASSTEEAVSMEWHAVERLEEILAETYAVRIMDAMNAVAARIRSHDGRALIDDKPHSA